MSLEYSRLLTMGCLNPISCY